MLLTLEGTQDKFYKDGTEITHNEYLEIALKLNHTYLKEMHSYNDTGEFKYVFDLEQTQDVPNFEHAYM